MEAPDHLLLVDDDRALLALLADYLHAAGYRISTAHNGAQMRQLLATGAPVDLVVLDLMLPGDDGLVLCRELRGRQAAPIPVLMLTARSEEADRILGLEMGADDYLCKPFATRELLARIKAVLRRTRMLPPNLQPVQRAAQTSRPALGAHGVDDAAAAAPTRERRFADWRVDTVARSLHDAHGTLVPLTGGEYRLLAVLLDHPQVVLSRDQLLGLTQGREADVFDRSIDLLVSRLRRRLRDDPKEPRLIKTVRNGGYVFCAEVHA